MPVFAVRWQGACKLHLPKATVLLTIDRIPVSIPYIQLDMKKTNASFLTFCGFFHESFSYRLGALIIWFFCYFARHEMLLFAGIFHILMFVGFL